jgi:hypothetical protein
MEEWMEKLPYRDVLRDTRILDRLSAFDPHLAGTPPLGIDLPTSDLDILCHAQDAHAFASEVWAAFSACADFSMHQWIGPDRPIIAGFRALGWRIEIFGQALPVSEQHGWRHFLIERRLLALGGPGFRDVVMRHRHEGQKTEPAFAATLGLTGNPYQALLQMEQLSDTELARLLGGRGFGRHVP